MAFRADYRRGIGRRKLDTRAAGSFLARLQRLAPCSRYNLIRSPGYEQISTIGTMVSASFDNTCSISLCHPIGCRLPRTSREKREGNEALPCPVLVETNWRSGSANSDSDKTSPATTFASKSLPKDLPSIRSTAISCSSPSQQKQLHSHTSFIPWRSLILRITFPS